MLLVKAEGDTSNECQPDLTCRASIDMKHPAQPPASSRHHRPTLTTRQSAHGACIQLDAPYLVVEAVGDKGGSGIACYRDCVWVIELCVRACAVLSAARPCSADCVCGGHWTGISVSHNSVTGTKSIMLAYLCEQCHP